MSETSSGDTERKSPEDDPVFASLKGELKTRYPDWRLTTHYTPEGRKVTMIEFADDNGKFTSGLPGDFVSMVSEAYGCSQDADTKQERDE